VTYDGVSKIGMDQMVVTFTMLAGLQWSDGSPLTADDSAYSFELAANDATPGSKFLIDRTQAYEAASRWRHHSMVGNARLYRPRLLHQLLHAPAAT
jgi:ABC-type transport system substrate-binding protein